MLVAAAGYNLLDIQLRIHIGLSSRRFVVIIFVVVLSF